MDPELHDTTLSLGNLLLTFGQTYRVTRFQDGKTRESDTDHTVMLGITACAIAEAYEPALNLGMVAQFALVHDLVEVYAGDTDTFGMHKDASKKQLKEEREAAALERLEKEYGAVFPWITNTIRDYESLASREARFVKTIDKIMPKITHTLNNGAYLRDLPSFEDHYKHQAELLRATYGADQKIAMDLYDAFTKSTAEMLRKRDGIISTEE